MKCPRCLSELVELGVAQGRALGCEHCGGLWLAPRTDLQDPYTSDDDD